MAKVFGSGEFGISSESALGMYAGDFSFDLTGNVEKMAGDTGNSIGVAVFDEEGTWSLTGFFVSGGTLGGDIGSAITVANAESDISAWVSGVETGGEKTILTSVKSGKVNRGFRTADLSGIICPYAGALQGS